MTGPARVTWGTGVLKAKRPTGPGACQRRRLDPARRGQDPASCWAETAGHNYTSRGGRGHTCAPAVRSGLAPTGRRRGLHTKGARAGRADSAPGAREANLPGPLRAGRVGRVPPAMGAPRGACTSFPRGSAHPSPLLGSPAAPGERAEGAWRAPRPRLRCIVMRREARLAGGGAWLGREAGAGPAAAGPRLALHPRKAGHTPRRCGAGAGRGPSPGGPAPYLNIDAARVGVALLPLSEAVSRGPASA